jgi:hypothetical protein
MAVRDPAPQPLQPEAAPVAADPAEAADPADPVEAVEAVEAAGGAADGAAEAVAPRTDGHAQRSTEATQAPTALLPLRRTLARPAERPVPLRSGLSRATRWRHGQLEPFGSTLRRMARHPAVVGSASAATLLVARAGVEVLREAMASNRRARAERGVIVGRRVVVEYVELWSRPR